ncbi:MAG: hypothetical protein CSA97_00750 [Bacteroidetes bacterium]|nr:MAG: hypothetical protein CSA97_00750 [Bacteroidota bacterium]
MRILHTSDWHLGIRFYGYDRTQEQSLFLDWLVGQIQAHDVDALVIAGDIFDVPSPAHHARRLYFDFLARLTTLPRPVQTIIVAGNHDSGNLLEAPAELLQALRIHVKGGVERSPGQPMDYTQFEVPLTTQDGRLATCLAVPYLRIADCPKPTQERSPLAEFYHQLGCAYQDHPYPIICTGHLYATGAKLASRSGESTQPKFDMVGSLERIAMADFPPHFTYLAFGHIHRMQALEGHLGEGKLAYYSGAPLPYSFRDHQLEHGVLLVDIEGEGQAKTTFLPYSSPVELRVLRGTKEQVIAHLSAVPEAEPDFLAPFYSIVCPLQSPEPGLVNIFQQAAKGRYLRLGPIQTPKPGDSRQPQSQRLHAPELQRLSPLPIAQEEYQKQYQQPMPEGMMAILEDIVQSVE